MTPDLSKTVYLLVGAKGSGKSYIGELLQRELSLAFLPIEKMHLALASATVATAAHAPNDGFDLEFKWIEEALLTKDEVVSEATGSSQYLSQFISNLSVRWRVKLIRVYCPLALCMNRVKRRSTFNQLLVPHDVVAEINRLSHNVVLDWSLQIENSGKKTDTEIVSLFKTQCV